MHRGFFAKSSQNHSKKKRQFSFDRPEENPAIFQPLYRKNKQFIIITPPFTTSASLKCPDFGLVLSPFQPVSENTQLLAIF
jgi:hypothetical protein